VPKSERLFSAPPQEDEVIRELIRGASWLDAWLRENLGRPYTVLLGVGLVAGISASLSGLGAEFRSGQGLVRIAVTVLFQLALLINQLAQFHEHQEQRRLRREMIKTDGRGRTDMKS